MLSPFRIRLETWHLALEVEGSTGLAWQASQILANDCEVSQSMDSRTRELQHTYKAVSNILNGNRNRMRFMRHGGT